MGLFSKSRGAARSADVDARSRKAKEKALALFEARWHMRPAGGSHGEAADAVRAFCQDVGFVRRATLAEVRASEKDPVRLLIGLRLDKGIAPRFDEVAASLRRAVKAKAPEAGPVEVELLDSDPTAPTPYDVFP